MVLESLGESLKNSIKKITNALFVDEKLINELIKDIQKSLLKADVNVKLVLELTSKMKSRLLEEKTPSSVSKKEHLVNIIYEELVNFLGRGEKVDYKNLVLKKKPYKIMLVGLFGSGKTTTSGKLAGYFKRRGIKVALISTDTWRPAALDQLKMLGKDLGVEVFGDKSVKDPTKLYQKFEKELSKFDLVIVDTAGRDALSDDLILELDKLNKKVEPDDVFLVISADIGQSAQKQAEAFHSTCGVNGVVITKLDGTARGGGALVACSTTGAPVRFIGVGEKKDDLEEFKPENFVSRLLGMGDLESLLEKTKDAFEGKDVEDLGRKFLKGDFNLIDLYEQMQSMKKMGPLNKVMDMIPGMSNVPKDMLKGQEEKIDKWKFVMQSMTKSELEDPEVITGSRVQRISEGSGASTSDVRSLLKQFRQTKKMMKMMKGGSEKDMKKMMQKFQGKGFKF